jgi:hypothetical protein
MMNIFKTSKNANSFEDRHSHDVILAAKRAAREAVIDREAAKWRIPLRDGSWPTTRPC